MARSPTQTLLPRWSFEIQRSIPPSNLYSMPSKGIDFHESKTRQPTYQRKADTFKIWEREILRSTHVVVTEAEL